MAHPEAHTWLELLSPAECWRLLATTPVGRLGVLVDSAPEIFPVNHIVDRDSILFRTDPGTKLRGLDRSPSVCFEVDEVDTDTSTGWSVLVKGRAVEVTDPVELRGVRELPLRFWVQGDKAHWIRVVVTEITGRRILSVHEPPTSAEGSVLLLDEQQLDVEPLGYL